VAPRTVGSTAGEIRTTGVVEICDDAGQQRASDMIWQYDGPGCATSWSTYSSGVLPPPPGAVDRRRHRGRGAPPADPRHGSPVDFFFWGVPATAASPEACMHTPAHFANRSAETKICYGHEFVGLVVGQYQHRICIVLLVVHGTGYHCAGVFATKISWRENNDLYRNRQKFMSFPDGLGPRA
jgi:hypothetical protein